MRRAKRCASCGVSLAFPRTIWRNAARMYCLACFEELQPREKQEKAA